MSGARTQRVRIASLFGRLRTKPRAVSGAVVLCAAVAIGLLLAATASSEIAQRGTLRVSFAARLAPRKLPRLTRAPVAVSFAGQISTTDRSAPPQLRRIVFRLNREGRLERRGIPACRYHQIQPATSAEARRSCRRSLVGHGTFHAHVALPEQSPFPSQGRLLAFNGTLHGRPVLYAHIYGTTPLPQSALLVFAIGRSRGSYGTVLRAQMPQVASDWGYVSSISLTLGRTFARHGERRSYLSAACPAPAGTRLASFRLARASFAFEGGRELTATLNRSCRVRG